MTPALPADLTLSLPMIMRALNPLGYRHGQINYEGLPHPGYDLNWGNSAWADLGRPVYAPSDGAILFAGPAKPWGGLIVGTFGPALTARYAWRLGHVQNITTRAGHAVEGGLQLAECGVAQITGSTPHLHLDVIDLIKARALGYGLQVWPSKLQGTHQDPKFSSIFPDPKLFFKDLPK